MESPRRDQPLENEASAFPRYRSGALPSGLGVNQQQPRSSSRHSGNCQASHPPGLQPAEQAKEMGGGG